MKRKRQSYTAKQYFDLSQYALTTDEWCVECGRRPIVQSNLCSVCFARMHRSVVDDTPLWERVKRWLIDN